MQGDSKQTILYLERWRSEEELWALCPPLSAQARKSRPEA